MLIRWMGAAFAVLMLLEGTVYAQTAALPQWLTDSVQSQAAADTAVDAKAAIVLEAATGQVLFAQNADEHLPMASTTKIMTAMLTLEQPDQDTEFTVDPQAIKVEGSSMGLTEGDTVTLRALTVGMLLSSGNDAACAAAVQISGSIPAFVKMMNQRAAELGLADTAFENPAGLDGEQHYSTARDMAMLAREALTNPEFLAICSQEHIQTSFGNPPYGRWLTNHNKLLSYCEDVIGVKTGFTKKAGRCLVSAAERNGVRLICVTLNCPDDWTVHQDLYDRYFAQVKTEDLAAYVPETVVPVTGGTVGQVATDTCASFSFPILTEQAEITCRVTAPQFLYAPVCAGQSIGEARIYLNGTHIHTFSLTAVDDVPLLHEYREKRSMIERLADIFRKGSST